MPVALTPTPRIQFSDQNGTPLAGGCVFTYNAGTSTPAATYVDIGGVVQNTNPVILDAAGRATIYLASQAYKISLFSSGGVNCASGTQQWVQDNVNAFQPVAGALSITFAGVTSDPAGVAGLMDYRSDLPCFRSFTTTWDCFVRLNDAQTLTNKTLTAAILNGTPTGTGLQGTDTKLLTSGTVSGVSVNLCTDANGGATTTGCTAAGIVSTSAPTNFGVALTVQTVVASVPTTGLYAIYSLSPVTTIGAGCSAASNSMQMTLAWTGPGGTAQTIALTGTSFTGNGVLDFNSSETGSGTGTGFIIAKAGTSITYTTTSTLTSTGCSPIPQYTVYVKAFN